MRESVSDMLMTIERQASEIRRLARQLEDAREELESTKARLRGFSSSEDVARLQDRQSFSVRLEEEIARCGRFGHPLSLAIFGLDECLTLDDGLRASKAEADETLREVAEILLKGSRMVDAVCRYGGRELAVLLVETPSEGARDYAGRIIEALSGSSSGRGERVTVSAGVSSCPDGAATSSDLFRGAEEALHAAGRAGTNRVALWMGPGVRRQVEPGAAPA